MRFIDTGGGNVRPQLPAADTRCLVGRHHSPVDRPAEQTKEHCICTTSAVHRLSEYPAGRVTVDWKGIGHVWTDLAVGYRSVM